MNKFKVSSVVDGDTFDVASGWEWGKERGSRVRPTGYDAPELGTYEGERAKQKLQNLIGGKEVELGDAKTIDRGRLVCDVFFNGRNLADYFPEYKT
jgi:endonuclease YncB( thermonuclease family)